MSSLPVVRLSEHSMGSPFNGVKEVLSPVAALGYGMISFLFLMNMWYYDMTKESCWYYDMSLDFMMRLIRREYEIMLKSLYRWYRRLRTTWYRCIDTKWYKHSKCWPLWKSFEPKSSESLKKSYLFGDRQISTEVVNEPVVVVCSASHILVLSYQCCRSEAMTSPAVPLWR